MLDKKIADKIHNLRLNYTDEPQPDLLIKIPNIYTERDYLVDTKTAEFTSLCPLNTGQPDHASIDLLYVPDKYLVELKSLKFYYTSFRTAKIFHEDVANQILNDLVATIQPREMIVTAHFTVRGGLHTEVTATYPNIVNRLGLKHS